MPAPRYTVIIPTRNRSEYLKAAIVTVLQQSSNDFELVVSNNHSTDDTAEMLAGFQDARLRIIQPPRPLAMVQHFEWVLKQAKGEWMTLIGDDDGLMPFFFEFADALTEGPAAELEVIYGPRPFYRWPGLEKIYGKDIIRFDANSALEILNSETLLQKLACNLSWEFSVPQFYSGTLFKRSLVERLCNTQANGKIFHSFTPDASSAISILLNTKKILKVGLPLGWEGSSPKSTGAQTFNAQRQSGALKESAEDFKKLNLNAGIDAHPRFKSILKIDGSGKVYFLESLYSVSLANNYGWHERFDDNQHRYRLFYAVYADQQKRKRKGLPVEAYDQLFLDNGLKPEGFEALAKSTRFARLGSYLEKQRQGLLRAVRRALPGPLNAFSHHCSTAGVYPSILTANAMLEEPQNRARIRSMIKAICER